MNIKLKITKHLFLIVLAWLVLPLTSFNSFDTNELGIRTVVIDAGHGGKDPGCSGASAKEKDICLSIALKLGKFISEKFENVKVVYTRKTDMFLELHERANIANQSKADLFICIHANSGAKGANGSETYIMGLHKSEANLLVAKRENSSILMEDNYKTVYEGFDPNSDEDIIALTLMQSSYMDQSLNIATKIQHHFEKIGRKNRGVKQAGFLVLVKTTMPSVLIETGFLTDKEEEGYLLKEENQTKMSSAIFDAFSEYKGEVEKNMEGLTDKPKETPVVVKEEVEEIKPPKKEVRNPPIYDNSKKTEITSRDNYVVFKVQFASLSKKAAKNSESFNGIDNVSYYEDKGMYKYVAGNESNLEDAAKLQSTIREKGYKDAFVVAFQGEKKISVTKALETLKVKP